MTNFIGGVDDGIQRKMHEVQERDDDGQSCCHNDEDRYESGERQLPEVRDEDVPIPRKEINATTNLGAVGPFPKTGRFSLKLSNPTAFPFSP